MREGREEDFDEAGDVFSTGWEEGERHGWGSLWFVEFVGYMGINRSAEEEVGRRTKHVLSNRSELYFFSSWEEVRMSRSCEDENGAAEGSSKGSVLDAIGRTRT